MKPPRLTVSLLALALLGLLSWLVGWHRQRQRPAPPDDVGVPCVTDSEGRCHV